MAGGMVAGDSIGSASPGENRGGCRRFEVGTRPEPVARGDPSVIRSRASMGRHARQIARSVIQDAPVQFRADGALGEKLLDSFGEVNDRRMKYRRSPGAVVSRCP